MRHCSKCLKDKSLSEFYRRKTGPRAGEYYEKCKVCMKARGRRYYHSNHKRQLSLALVRRRRSYYEKRKYLNSVKNRPCADCRKRYPYYVMDFDHINADDKINDVATMVTKNWSLDNIKIEVKKCEVVCANCHRIRTYGKHAEVVKVVTTGL